MENKKGSEIFLGVIGVATLIVAIIGATFAYFSANTGSEDEAIGATSTAVSLSYEDKLNTSLSTALIPSAENIATYGAMNATWLASNDTCVDENGNEICSLYEFTVTNPSSTTALDINFSLDVVTNDFTNLKYKIYAGSISPSAEGANKDATEIDNTAETVIAKTDMPAANTQNPLTALKQVLQPSTSVTYTMLIWLNEEGDKNIDEVNKSFAAGLKVTSGANGQGVTGVIAGAN